MAALAEELSAAAQVCSGCHGENGVPVDAASTPIIWGQQASYLYKQLHDYKSGDRSNPVMAAVVQDIPLPRLRELARQADPQLTEGVYAGLPGPQYETPAEIRMLRTLGADLVGMSTVHETIAARAEGAEVLGV